MTEEHIKPYWWTKWRPTQFLGVVIGFQWRAFLRNTPFKECLELLQIAWLLTYGGGKDD